MGVPLLALVTVVYAAVALTYVREQRWGMCLAFVAYALANVGFILDMVKK